MGILPSVAEPLRMAVCFLKPKVVVGVAEVVEEEEEREKDWVARAEEEEADEEVEDRGGFLESSGHWWWWPLVRGDRQLFSDTLASSVLPVD